MRHKNNKAKSVRRRTVAKARAAGQSSVAVSTGHVITHTHWDREWRVPVWHARMRLLQMFDSLLEAFRRDPGFKHFLFDGQVIGIEDYLEMRPAHEGLVRDLIRAGRLQIGPWYNLPDEHPVEGEALIRNLLIGTRRAEHLGGCMRTAWLSFGWGQTAQLPQILAGFGIDFVFVGKNVSRERAPQSEFFWRSPDGTRLLATRLGDEGRANFYFTAIMPAMYGVSYHDPACKVEWGRGGWLWRRAGRTFDLETTFLKDPIFHDGLIASSIDDAWRTTDDTLVPQHRFLGHGTDSTAPYEHIDRLMAGASGPGRVLKHSGIEEYTAELRRALEKRGLDRLVIVDGELRDGPTYKVSANALAVRAPVKTLNRRAQLRLIRYAEPLATAALMCGEPYPEAFCEKAWHYLLLAHSHDAINGVTQDKTARDTVYRLEQALELAEAVADNAAGALMKKINVSWAEPGDVLLAVFNLSNIEAGHVMRAEIDMPEELNPHWVDIADAGGGLCRVQPLGGRHMAAPVNVVDSRAMPFYCDRHELYFDTGPIPPMGYKVFRALPRGKLNRKTEFWNDIFDMGSQVTGPHRMANEFLEVAFNPNGTFDLLHKASGKWRRGLHFFEDSGDAGDYWQRVSPWRNSVFTTLAGTAAVSLVEDGPLVTTFHCEWSMEIPRGMARKDGRRDDVRVPLAIRSRVTLRAGAPYLEIETTVDNRAMDHRLRACFPTFLPAGESVAQGHFNTDSRPVSRPRDSRGIRDDGMGTLPMQHFVDLAGGDAGLAVLNRNVMEYEISDDESRTINLTLLRCVPMRICTEFRCATEDASQTGGQCPGEHVFEYALYPHCGDVWAGRVYETTEHYLVAPLAYQFSRHSRADARLPRAASFMAIRPSAVQVAAFKKAQDGESCILRLYNPGAEPLQGSLVFAVEPKSVELATLDEKPVRKLSVNRGSVSFEFEPYKIVTFSLKF